MVAIYAGTNAAVIVCLCKLNLPYFLLTFYSVALFCTVVLAGGVDRFEDKYEELFITHQCIVAITSFTFVAGILIFGTHLQASLRRGTEPSVSSCLLLLLFIVMVVSCVSNCQGMHIWDPLDRWHFIMPYAKLFAWPLS
jgi:hypothetical protein